MRDTSFSITKAIAIIMVVMAHACVPGWTCRFIYQFHVPVFFICAGYFFNTRYLNDEKTYLMRRIKGLYLPFLRWSLLFLLLHNLLFPLGLLSEQFGNNAGGVLHPYTWTEFSRRLFSIVFNMSGYDEFLAGSFWFFRSLFVASLLFLILFKVLRRFKPALTDAQAGQAILGLSFLATLWLVGADFRIAGLAGGGYRELLGVCFFSVGFLFRVYRERVPLGWPLALGCLLVAVLGASKFPSSMGHHATLAQFFSLLLPAVAGFGMVYILSLKLSRHTNFLTTSLNYIGNNTLYIFAFHLLAFKLVSAIKVGVYHLPWEMVGGHTVVNAHPDDYFWVLYTIVGVALPLGVRELYRYYAARYTFTYGTIGRYALKYLLQFLFLTGAALKWLIRAICDTAVGIWRGIQEIISASNPKDE